MSLQGAMQRYKSFDLQQQQQQSQQAADGFDPFAMMYGGNIAAACAATNQSVTESKEQELDAGEEKKRQRASNRLTAWQSRERKRIEFEVMKDRKANLTKQNEDLKRENEQLQRVIQQVKEAKRIQVLRGGAASPRQTTPANHHAVAASNFSKMLQQQQDKMRLSLSVSSMRRDLPHLMSIQDCSVFSSLPAARLLPHDANAPYIQQRVGATTFAPLERQQHLEHQLHHALAQFGANVPDFASASGRGAPYFRTLAHLSTMQKDPQEESTPGRPTKRPRQEL